MDYARIGRYVRNRRDVVDLSQAELGERAGMSATKIKAIEAGEPRPGRRGWPRLERALGWQVGDVEAIGRGGEPTLDREQGEDPPARAVHPRLDGSYRRATELSPQEQVEVAEWFDGFLDAMEARRRRHP